MQMNLFGQKEETKINFQPARDFIKTQHQLIERDTINVADVGPWGIKWRGADIPNDDSMFQDDYTAQFGFTCAECGGSGVNKEPVNHLQNCEREENE